MVNLETMVIKNIKIPTKKLTIQCDCEGMEFLQFLVFERSPWEEDGKYETDEMYINFIGHEMYGFKNKLKAIWQIIRNGEYENNGLISDRKQIEEVQKYLKQVLKYWDKNYEKLPNKESSMEELDKKLDEILDGAEEETKK